MKVLSSFAQISPPLPSVVTLGNFDGIHQGHQKLFHAVHQIAKPQGTSIAISFLENPANVFHPEHAILPICTNAHKIKLFEGFHFDYLFLIPFTKEFASQTAEDFLLFLKKKLSLTHLVLGHNAKFGKNREGNTQKIAELTNSVGFTITYIPPFLKNLQPVSSTRIRNSIKQGNLQEASDLLGRPYSIYAEVIKGLGMATGLGFPTANLEVSHLCLPPQGVYTITLKYLEHTFSGIANLGVSPTVKTDAKQKLEVHLFNFDNSQTLYGMSVEIIFHNYMRPERRFNNLDELKRQIAIDISEAKAFHGIV